MALFTPLPSASIDGLTIDARDFATPDAPLSGIRAAHLPAEWAPQSGVQLTWPHAHTDWAPVLERVCDCYVHMALEIALREPLLVVCADAKELRQFLTQRLPTQALRNITLCECPTNDTWARDHGFVTLLTPHGPRMLDFQFNGWGKKFSSELDNQINRWLVEQGIFPAEYYEDHLPFVLEGGSIESDGCGTILTTAHCLLAPHRNQPMSLPDIEAYLLHTLHASRVLWLHHGALQGDDTDSHIDTLARLCPNHTIAYVQCTDPTDVHFEGLRLMEEELSQMRTIDDQPYRLLPLPLPAPMMDDEGERLPATYANFLVINGAVLMPTYGQPQLDALAARQLQRAFPRHQIVGIDCRVLVLQHGSLHCCTMQFPIGTFKPQNQ